MTVSILWIDDEQAKLFLFSEERMQREVFQITHLDFQPDGLLDSLKGEWGQASGETKHAMDQQAEAYERLRLFKFFQRLMISLQAEKKILILGPGVAKHQFYQYLKEIAPEISKRVQTCEELDDPSDEKIARYAMTHFKHS